MSMHTQYMDECSVVCEMCFFLEVSGFSQARTHTHRSHLIFLCMDVYNFSVLHIFWTPDWTVSWRSFFNRTQCPDDAEIIDTKLAVHKIWLLTKHKKDRFSSLIISLGTAAIVWFLIMKSLLVQLYSLHSMIHCNCALHVHGRILPPKPRDPAVLMRMLTHLCGALAWGFSLVGKE